jgi:hypothetical protein
MLDSMLIVMARSEEITTPPEEAAADSELLMSSLREATQSQLSIVNNDRIWARTTNGATPMWELMPFQRARAERLASQGTAAARVTELLEKYSKHVTVAGPTSQITLPDGNPVARKRKNVDEVVLDGTAGRIDYNRGRMQLLVPDLGKLAVNLLDNIEEPDSLNPEITFGVELTFPTSFTR